MYICCMIKFIKNIFASEKYTYHKDAVIIACYFNPQRNSYRQKAFTEWYNSIKHLNHYILEGVLEGDSPEFGPSIQGRGRIETIKLPGLLWHKETMLNKIIEEVKDDFKYIFWLDTDIIFDNMDWLIDSVQKLRKYSVVQPFEYCRHLEQNQSISENPITIQNQASCRCGDDSVCCNTAKHTKTWRSFAANVGENNIKADSTNYDVHGHVGFAWGARTSFLVEIGGLFDAALIGGADHIMAHAFAGQSNPNCITRSFGDYLPEIKEWSTKVLSIVRKSLYHNDMLPLSNVKGNLYHIWHGDTEKREYYKRIKEFTPLQSESVTRSEDGFFVIKPNIETDATNYFVNYFNHRETTSEPLNLGVEPLEMPTNPDNIFEGGQFGGSGAGDDWSQNFS